MIGLERLKYDILLHIGKSVKVNTSIAKRLTINVSVVMTFQIRFFFLPSKEYLDLDANENLHHCFSSIDPPGPEHRDGRYVIVSIIPSSTKKPCYNDMKVIDFSPWSN